MNDVERATVVSPLLMEVVKNALDTIADELALIIMRTAYSSIVRDAMDYSTAICDRLGNTLAQGLTTPLHLGSFADAMQNLRRREEGRIRDGDLFIFNDPYLAAGQHLPDIYVVRPIFVGHEIEGWATTVAHHNDVGGLVAGSNAIGSVEIFQEGLRLPLLRLHDAGRENTAILAIIAANVRVPEKVLGDISAQVAACEVGEREFKALFRRYDRCLLRRCFAAIHDYAECLARAEFAEIPDGTYRFSNAIDGIGETGEPIRFQVALTVKGSNVIVDWTGTQAQVAAGINAPIPFTRAAVYTALRSVIPGEVPNAFGFTRPITVIAPPGTVANPLSPAACGARGITGFRMIDCMFGALAKAVPEQVAADGSGGATLPSIAGWDRGHAFVFVETMMGTSGATASHDGQEGVAHLGANQSNIPIELIEREYPLLIEQYAMVADTGGPGKFRGGLSIVRDFRLLGPEAVLSVRSDKRRFRPFGLNGGREGSGSWNIINPDGEARVLPVLTDRPIELRQGDLYRHVTAAGGGFGNPFERDPEQVLSDVRLGRVSIAHARQAYGVVIVVCGDDFAIDGQATARLRAGSASDGA